MPAILIWGFAAVLFSGALKIGSNSVDQASNASVKFVVAAAFGYWIWKKAKVTL